MYAAAIEKTRLDYQSTRRIKMVAKAFPLLRRRKNSSWSHHAADIAHTLLLARSATAIIAVNIGR
jgi:hypothetical protein